MGSSMGSFKLNTSGISREKSSAYGGILRDEKGCWMIGFMSHTKTGSKRIDAELFVMFKAIELGDSLGLQNSTLEIESLFAFDILKNPDDKFTRKAKISNSKKQVEKNGITLNLITPEENKCAAFLTKLAIDDEYEDVLNLPPGIQNFIKACDQNPILAFIIS